MDSDEFKGADRHQDNRDRKRARRDENARMRGNRSVFEIQKAIVKRGRNAVKRNKGDSE